MSRFCPSQLPCPPGAASRRRRAFAALGACLALAACGTGDGARAADDDLARDLALAGAVTPLPALGEAFVAADTALARAASLPAAARLARRPSRPAPATRVAEGAGTAAIGPNASPTEPSDSAPAASPDSTLADSAGAGRGRTIGAGIALALATGGRVCSETTRPGDRLVATLREPARGADGTEIPAGSTIVLELASIAAGPSGETVRVEFLARGASIDGGFVPLVADVEPVEVAADRQAVANTGGIDRGKVARGAITGAILGRVLGGRGKGTVIGAAAGAATAAARGAAGKRHELCLPAATAVHARLAAPLALP